MFTEFYTSIQCLKVRVSHVKIQIPGLSKEVGISRCYGAFSVEKGCTTRSSCCLHSPCSGSSVTFGVWWLRDILGSKRLFCNLMPLFYGWRDWVPDKPRYDLRGDMEKLGAGPGLGALSPDSWSSSRATRRSLVFASRWQLW